MLKKRKQNKNEIIENPAVSKGTGIVITIVMTLLAVMHRSHCQIRILFPECTIM